MTKYFCKKCNTRMKVIEKSTTTFTCIMKCPKCGAEIVADHKEDLI